MEKNKYYKLKSLIHRKVYTMSCIRRYSSNTVKFTSWNIFYRKAEKLSIQNIYKYKWKRYKIAEKMIEKYSEKVIVLSFPEFRLFQLLIVFFFFFFFIVDPNFYYSTIKFVHLPTFWHKILLSSIKNKSSRNFGKKTFSYAR